jgi:hypothetical protein
VAVLRWYWFLVVVSGSLRRSGFRLSEYIATVFVLSGAFLDSCGAFLHLCVDQDFAGWVTILRR